MEKDTKTTKVSKKLHKDLKLEAIKRGITLQSLLEEIIKTYFNGR